MESHKFTIGILKEVDAYCESRAAFTPAFVSELTSAGARVLVEKSDVRCFEDADYHKHGAILVDKIEEAGSKALLLGIKPIYPQNVIPDTNYMFYSRIANNLEATIPLRNSLLEANCSFIDYEVVKDSQGNALIGTSRLAGRVGAFNTIRALGEFMLTKGCRKTTPEGVTRKARFCLSL
ncbi:unnamed protein product [Moneuplotes crassus]|uniref:Alanine dehydrogenase/pyridine nucleotide transhydrogenase N-terminal domain-containing protein n=1 Tax=Euplotes crassus TaxID=5936 RepID=A0AAD1UK79_EUPCR|nr:unnamed protein product [Moneuplotes crassus]